MEKGNEGDEIILFAFRQLECAIPENVNSIGQITADTLCDIIARSLWLISQGETKFAVTLPPNIASRHRICTNMANKIKELGFTGECGYNQLLYPVESQTKTLLIWLVQKLPRNEEEQAEEVLGANAMLNRKVTQTLSAWRKKPWLLSQSCRGVPPRNIYTTKALVTLGGGIDAPTPLSKRSVVDIFAECNASRIAPESTVLERHAAELVTDSKFSLSLEGGGAGSGLEGEESSTGSLRDMKKAFAAAMNKGGKGPGANVLAAAAASASATASAAAAAGMSSTEELQAGLMGKSLADLIQGMDREANEGGSNGNGDGPSSSGAGGSADANAIDSRGSRFAHASEFGKDSGNAAMLVMTSDAPAPSSSTATDEADADADGGAEVAGAPGMSSREKAAAAAEARARAKKAKEEEDERKREAELQGLRDNIAELAASMDAKQRQMDNVLSQIRGVESEHSALLLQSEGLEREIVVKRKTLEMLPTAADNIAKLQQICGASAKRLMQLAQEWEQHRVPLIEKYRKTRNVKITRKARCKQMIEEMRRYKEEMQNMLIDLRNKQEKSRMLEDELKKLPRNINRNLYTVRIMEIITSINKQNKDITKITNDIREIQKTINTFTNTLQRADAVAEDKVFSAANGPNRDTAMVESYRHLSNLRSSFETLIAAVNKMGQHEKQTRDLETKIDQEVSRVSGNNIERITADLEQIKGENSQLVNQIKVAQRSQK